MRISSVLTITLAISAGFGAYLLLTLGNSGAEPPTPAKGETIVVAAKPLVFGQQLQVGHLKLVPWTDRVIPDGAFTGVGQLVPPIASYRMLANLSVDEPLLQNHLTSPQQNASFSSLIHPDKKAVTVHIKDSHGVVRFLKPGEYVDVFVTYSGNKSRAPAYTDLLLRKARVLTIDKQAGERNKAGPGKAITLEVDAQEAQELVLATTVGQISLALRNGAGPLKEGNGRVDINDLQRKRALRTSRSRDKPIVIVRRQGGHKEYRVSPDRNDGSETDGLRLKIGLKSHDQEPK